MYLEQSKLEDIEQVEVEVSWNNSYLEYIYNNIYNVILCNQFIKVIIYK